MTIVPILRASCGFAAGNDHAGRADCDDSADSADFADCGHKANFAGAVPNRALKGTYSAPPAGMDIHIYTLQSVVRARPFKAIFPTILDTPIVAALSDIRRATIYLGATTGSIVPIVPCVPAVPVMRDAGRL